MPFPTLAWLARLEEPARGILENFGACLTGFLKAEHKDDGSHGTVTADSLTSAAGVYDHGRAKAMGEVTHVPYQAAHFTASSGTWTVDAADVQTYCWTVIGQTMIVWFEITTSDVSAAAADLQIAIPGGYLPSVLVRDEIQVSDAGAARAVGVARVNTDLPFIFLQSTIAGAAWTITAADNTLVRGQISFPIKATS